MGRWAWQLDGMLSEGMIWLGRMGLDENGWDEIACDVLDEKLWDRMGRDGMDLEHWVGRDRM